MEMRHGCTGDPKKNFTVTVPCTTLSVILVPGNAECLALHGGPGESYRHQVG